MDRNLFEAISFLGQYGNSNSKINGLGISNKLDGINYSSSFRLTVVLLSYSFITLLMKAVGESALRNLAQISCFSLLKLDDIRSDLDSMSLSNMSFGHTITPGPMSTFRWKIWYGIIALMKNKRCKSSTFVDNYEKMRNELWTFLPILLA